MARSVATHPYSSAVVYLNLSEELSGLDCHDEYESLIDTLTHVLRKRFPAFSTRTLQWRGDENKLILVSMLAEVSVAEYCGLVSVCLAPVMPGAPLSESWCDRATPGFQKVLHKAFPDNSLRSIGRASNGEQFFAPLNRVGGLVTSKEGTLW